MKSSRNSDVACEVSRLFTHGVMLVYVFYLFGTRCLRVPPFVHVSALIGHTNGYLVRCGVSRVAMLAAERFFAASCVLVGLVS